MKRVRWLSGLFAAGVLCVMLGTVGAQVAQAQRPIPWTALKCQVQGWQRSIHEDIIVSREIYTSMLRIFPGTNFTCKLPGGRAFLELQFAIPDKERKAPIKVDVYVDGNHLKSLTGEKGKVHTMLTDVSNGKSLSIDVDCAAATDCLSVSSGPFSSILDGYNFIKFQVVPGASSPGRR